MIHPLKFTCLLTLAGLLITQLSLFLIPGNTFAHYSIVLLSLPLSAPLVGFIKDNLYTYKWSGFLALFYFCVGMSELFVNAALSVYAYCTSTLSILLFFSAIYYSRWLRLNYSA